VGEIDDRRLDCLPLGDLEEENGPIHFINLLRQSSSAVLHDRVHYGTTSPVMWVWIRYYGDTMSLLASSHTKRPHSGK
jgi:hypothetical protein